MVSLECGGNAAALVCMECGGSAAALNVFAKRRYCEYETSQSAAGKVTNSRIADGGAVQDVKPAHSI